MQARDVSLTLQPQLDSSILNVFAASVIEIAPESLGQVMVALDCSGQRLLARITRQSAESLHRASGTFVYMQINGVAILK